MAGDRRDARGLAAARSVSSLCASRTDLTVLIDAQADTDHDAGVDRDELLDTLALLERLHPRRREMLLLKVAGFTTEEIAARHGITTARAVRLIYKARLQLARRRLE